ncbi:MAG: ribbon-helix-helix domain-containing protein [Promethearchaeota archaeon]
MTQVQVRLPEKLVEYLDKCVSSGGYKSRSDVIRTILQLWEEREKTRDFYKELQKRSREAREHPESLIKFEDL